MEENPGIDLMLLDINMPQMDGFEVLKWMKLSQCIEETPVIMISSEESVETMRKAYEMGITDYITRPFDSVIVKKRVQNTLGLYANQKRLINVVVDQVYEKEENNNIMIRILSNVLGSRNSESSEHILHIRTASEMMLRQLVKTTDSYHLTETDIAIITTASSLHDIGKIRIPEEILNKGWFTNASSRAMMIHSRVFDTKIPNGEVIGKDGMVTMLNELKRYAVTKEITVSVKDEQGAPAEGAEVSFEVLNYSEYAPIAEKKTDSKGTARLTTGLGSLHISARMCSDGEWFYAETVMNTEKEDNCEICLVPQDKRNDGESEKWTAADIFAPHDAPVNTDMPTLEQKAKGNKRLAAANAHREQKVRNWSNPECERFLEKKVNRIEEAIAASYREDLLRVLTEKDRTDCISDVLEEHLELAIPYHGMMKKDTFVSYVLNPRVDDEVLQKYRREIKKHFSRAEKQELRDDPSRIWNLIEKAIVSRPEKERSSVITTPAGCIRTCTGSFLSKKILFVAIARTLGVAARLNPHDRSMEYMENGRFVPVLARTEKNCTLILKAGETVQWKYFQNWSIAKLENGRYTSLKLGAENFEDQILNLPLESGNYRILTSNRLPNGNMFANEYHFEIQPGETKEIELVLREADLEDMLENISMPEFMLKTEDGTEVKASDLTADGKHILMFLEEEKEPTEHILNEMMEQEGAFAGYAEQIIFVVRSKEALETPTLSKALAKLKNIQIYYDDFSEIINTLGRRMYVDPDKLPLIIVTNRSLNGIYATSGYNVGTGDMLLRLM
mgnify:CR=1 FL=1